MKKTRAKTIPPRWNGAGTPPEAEGWRIQVRESVGLAIGEEGLTPTLVSREAGVSPKVLQAFLRDSYRGDALAVARKLDAWLKRVDERKRAAPPRAFAHTSHTKRIYAALRLVHDQGGIAAVYGDPGIGKTATFLAYREEFPATVLLTASPAARSPRPLMIRFLKALNRGTRGNLSALVSAAEFHLAKSGRLLIVDEAQHLTTEALDLLRYLVDACEIRLVLGGNNTVWDRFHARGGIPFEQLTSRVTVRLHLDAGRMMRGDVEVVVRQALNDVPRDCVDWFFERAPHQVGHYRFIVNHCRLAKQIAGGRPVTAEHLEAAGRMMA